MTDCGVRRARWTPMVRGRNRPASAFIGFSETDDHRPVAASRRLHLMIDLHVQGRQGRQGRAAGRGRAEAGRHVFPSPSSSPLHAHSAWWPVEVGPRWPIIQAGFHGCQGTPRSRQRGGGGGDKWARARPTGQRDDDGGARWIGSSFPPPTPSS